MYFLMIIMGSWKNNGVDTMHINYALIRSLTQRWNQLKSLTWMMTTAGLPTP